METLHNKLHYQYSSSDIIGMKKSMTKWYGHAACIQDFDGKEGRMDGDLFDVLDIGERIIIK
jgi:hypothetical protein